MIKSVGTLFLALVLLISCTPIYEKQEPVTLKSAPAQSEAVKETQPRTFSLGIGDEVEVNVWRHAELQRNVTIDPAGRIYLPLVGEISAAGLTVSQLRTLITEKLAQYYVNPQVDVVAVNIASRKFYVLGEVKNPGSYQLNSDVGILEAVATAGGLNDDANSKGLLIRRQGEDVKITPLTVRFAKIDQENLPDTTTLLRNMDILYMPASRIANVEKFMQRLGNIISPIISLERGVIMYPDFEDVLGGNANDDGGKDVIVAP